jgi:hypothetical protein
MQCSKLLKLKLQWKFKHRNCSLWFNYWTTDNNSTDQSKSHLFICRTTKNNSIDQWTVMQISNQKDHEASSLVKGLSLMMTTLSWHPIFGGCLIADMIKTHQYSYNINKHYHTNKRKGRTRQDLPCSGDTGPLPLPLWHYWQRSLFITSHFISLKILI